MVTKNESLIAQIKLRELAQQRSWLSQTYDELEQQIEHAETQSDQLQILFTGLQKIKMIETSLHPDVANLEPLLNEHQLSQEAISFWRRRLGQELSQGRLRSELIYIFGALLEEWVQEKSQDIPPAAAGFEKVAQLLELAGKPAEALSDFSLLDDLFADRSFMKMDIAASFQKSAATILQDRITVAELKKVLEHLSTSLDHTSTIHRQAKGFLQDDMMCKELADALSILLTHVDEWAWSEEGVSPFPLWTKNRWRLFITYDLFTMCFLEVLGARLQEAFQRFLAQERQEREKQLRDLFEESAHNNPEQLSQQLLHLDRLAHSDIWANLFSDSDDPLSLDYLKACLENTAYMSIAMERESLHEKLRQANTILDGYDARRSIDGLGTTLQFINAEIQLARTAFPDTPLYVLKFDLKDFYPSLPHDLVLAILERYGFSQSQLAFFRKFLQIPVRNGDENIYAQRGLPLHHRFSNVMGEMVLQLLDQHILRSARAQVIRLVDDVCILAHSAEETVKAWQAVQEFCQSTGLTINWEKCGTVCIGGEVPAQLPQAQPRWLLVTLNQDGEWQVDGSAFELYLEQVRKQVLYYPSLLTRVDVYSSHVKYLIRATAMECDLGVTHRRSTEVVAAQFHQAFFAEGHGMVEALRQTIQQRFFDKDTTVSLPEAWFYWPITAGGCGLTHAMILASGYAERYAVRKTRIVPEKRLVTWQKVFNDWSGFYSSFSKSVRLKEPTTTNSMEMLVNDFIHRSNEMGNSKQKTLSAYWRWILYIYGPQILEHLGTFRFLSTDLVPLQIILQQHQRDTNSEDDSAVDDDGVDDIPF